MLLSHVKKSLFKRTFFNIKDLNQFIESDALKCNIKDSENMDRGLYRYEILYDNDHIYQVWDSSQHKGKDIRFGKVNKGHLNKLNSWLLSGLYHGLYCDVYIEDISDENLRMLKSFKNEHVRFHIKHGRINE